MTALTIVSLLTGSLAATSKGAGESDRLQLLAGTLLATGFLLLGAGLHVALAGRI